MNVGLLAPAVGAQAGDGPVIEGRGAERGPEHQRTDESAGELGDPVADRLGQRDAPGEQGPTVTAGLTWLPDIGPIMYTSASRVRPNASAVTTTPAAKLARAS